MDPNQKLASTRPGAFTFIRSSTAGMYTSNSTETLPGRSLGTRRIPGRMVGDRRSSGMAVGISGEVYGGERWRVMG